MKPFEIIDERAIVHWDGQSKSFGIAEKGIVSNGEVHLKTEMLTETETSLLRL